MGAPDSSNTVPLTGSETTGVLCGDRPCACAVEIAAGEEHTCAVRDDGSVVCWGINDQGELGIGHAGDPEPWPQVVALPGDVTADALETGNHITCVTGSDGALYCWGRNTHGEVLPVDLAVPQPTPVRIDFVPSGGAVGLSPRHSCVAAADGATLSCFGENLRGQLGDVGPEPGPYTVMDPGGLLPPIDQLAAGRQYTCARSGPIVSCWGADAGGALGDGAPIEDTNVPGAVLLADDAMHLTSGREHACAAIGDGRRIQCWGDNAAGQLATGKAGPSEPAPVDAIEMFDAPIAKLVSRLDSTCAMTTSGALSCWGGNAEDKYGTGGPFEPQPVEVSILDEIGEAPIAVALGEWHMCVITEGAHVWCWGADDVEQVGPFDPMPGERAVELDLRCPEM
jgi:alpha-tubulin suppressor-like RCC1 family protein